MEKTHEGKEKLIKILLAFISFVSIFILVSIIVFLLKESFYAIEEVGLFNLIFGVEWVPSEGKFGAFSFIISSIIITIVALLIAVPFGVSCAILLSEIANDKLKQIVRPAIELLAGIPSIVYGLFGLAIVVKFIKISFSLASGKTLLAGSIILAIMILPIIISISHDAMERVPRTLREASFSLGSTRWQTIKNVVLPCALPGIVASIILAMGRAIGETMAVVLVLGNVEKLPTSLLEPGEALTSAILLEMGEVVIGSLHYSALFFLGVILLTITFVLSLISNYLIEKYELVYARR